MGEKEVTDAMVYSRTPLRKPIQKTKRPDCGVMEGMTITTSDTGRLGEELAAEYLREKKFVLREKNVRFGRYEIDIVAYDPSEKMIVFIEVKTRSSRDTRYPVWTAVDQRKRRALYKAIFRWTAHHQYDGPARIDIICVANGRVQDHIIDIGSDFF